LSELEDISIVKEVNCSTGVIKLRSDKILTFTPHQNVTTVNLPELKEQYDIFLELTNGTPHLFYMNAPHMKKLGPEERVFIGANSHNFCTAMAIRENSPLTRFLVHSVLYLNKPKVKVRMFKDETSSINWLKSLEN
jgi:hypothetical protein